MKGQINNIKIFSILFVFIWVYIPLSLSAQIIKTDIQLLKENNQDTPYHNQIDNRQINNTKPIEYKKNNPVIKYNPVNLTFTGAMLFYQHIVSPQLFKHCIYKISCSNFSKQAIQHFGLIKGIFLSTDRLMRCNSMAKDEIPAYEFDKNGLAVDEPDKYDTH